MARKPRRAGLALALACLLAAPSCVTAALWDQPHCGRRWHGADVAVRVVLTPFALLLDGVLLCGQAGGCCHR